MPIDPRLLRHAMALAKHGTFSRAARVLGLTQPALSKSIRALEDAVGCELFDRDARDLCPTAAGRALLLEAERLLERLDDLPHELSARSEVPAGRLVVGLGQFGATDAVLGAIASLADRFPGLDIELVLGGWWNLESLLRGREIDVYVGECGPVEADPSLEACVLSVDACRWVVRKEHPLAGRDAAPTRELFEWPIAVPPLPRAAAAWLVRQRAESGGRGGLLVCHGQAFLQRVVASSDAVGIASERSIAENAAHGALVPIGAPEAMPSVRVLAVTLRGRPLTTLARSFVDALAEHAVPDAISPAHATPASGVDEPVEHFVPYDRFLTPRLEWSPILRLPTRRVDSRALEYVSALAREGSFSRAARRVGLTQSGLSKAISSLEERIGTPLFTRSPTGATPTPAGEEMLRRLGPLLERLEGLPTRLSALATRKESRVSIGLGGHATADWVADAIGAMLDAHPEIEVQLVFGNWFEMEPALRAGELDVFVGHPNWAAREQHVFDVRTFLSQQHACWAREGHPLTGRVADLPALTSHPIALPFFLRTDDGDTGVLDAFRSGMIVCNHVSVLRRLVLRGNAVLGASPSALFGATDLVRLETWIPAVDTSIGAVTLRGRATTPGATAIVEALAKRAGAFGADA